jgi:hypothetical protein
VQHCIRANVCALCTQLARLYWHKERGGNTLCFLYQAYVGSRTCVATLPARSRPPARARALARSHSRYRCRSRSPSPTRSTSRSLALPRSLSPPKSLLAKVGPKGPRPAWDPFFPFFNRSFNREAPRAVRLQFFTFLPVPVARRLHRSWPLLGVSPSPYPIPSRAAPFSSPLHLPLPLPPALPLPLPPSPCEGMREQAPWGA